MANFQNWINDPAESCINTIDERKAFYGNKDVSKLFFLLKNVLAKSFLDKEEENRIFVYLGGTVFAFSFDLFTMNRRLGVKQRTIARFIGKNHQEIAETRSNFENLKEVISFEYNGAEVNVEYLNTFAVECSK